MPIFGAACPPTMAKNDGYPLKIMASLVVCLPSGAAGPTVSYAYVASPNGQQMQQQGSATAVLLPDLARGSELVAVVPSAALSWHAVDLPSGLSTASPRLRSVLSGLLEDQVLDDIDALHLALAPQIGSGPNGQTWVAACNRAWLQSHLQALEAAQRPVSRVVPEFAPDLNELQLHAVGDAESAWWVITGKPVKGLMRLPFSSSAMLLLPALDESSDMTAAGDQLLPLVFSEPALAEQAEQFTQRKVNLMTRPQRWLDAARSAWDLAQFDLARNARSRALKKVSGALGSLLGAPQWRPVRWGAVALLVVNAVGLNVWAWRQSADLATTRAAIESTLTQTFPGVKVVVDAPLQMQREVVALRQASGAVSSGDLEAMLAALGASAQPGMRISSIDFSAGELRVKGLAISPQEAGSLPGELKAKGYAVVVDSDSYVIKTSNLGAQ